MTAAGRSRSLKVTHFDTDRKHVCDFLLLNNTNLYHILHHFRVITAYWIKLSLLTGRCLYLTPSFRLNPWNLYCEIWLQKTLKNLSGVVRAIFWYIEPFGLDHQCDRQTDGHNYDSDRVRLTSRAKTSFFL